MNRTRAIFRTDAGSGIGYGHFVRSLAVASMVCDDYECVFATRYPSDYINGQLKGTASLVCLPEQGHEEAFLDMLSGNEIVFLDNYFFTSDFQRRIRETGAALIVPDDMHDRHDYADVVINQKYVPEEMFSVEPYTRLCLGPQWAMLRQPFLRPLPQSRGADVFVSFGGADPNGAMPHVLPMLRDCLPSHVTVNVVAGSSVSVPDIAGVRVFRNVDAVTVADIMDSSSFAVLAASGVCYEALSRHLPVVTGFHVGNQLGMYAFAVTLPGVVGVGDFLTLTGACLACAVDRVASFDPADMFPDGDPFRGVAQRYRELFASLKR